jgi:hypothetical protein
VDDELAVTGGDDVSLTQHNAPNPQPVDLGPVGAPQVNQVAEWGPVVDLEMVPRQDQILGHGKLCARRPADRARIPPVDDMFFTGVRARRDPKHNGHRHFPHIYYAICAAH